MFIGNCIAEMVAAGLASAAVAAEAYDVVAVPLHLRRLEDAAVQAALGRARFVFVQQIAEPLIDQIDRRRPAGSELILLPNLVMRSYWPFADGHEFKDPVVMRLAPGAPAHMHDAALAALRQVEPDTERRVQLYRSLDFAMASRIARVFEVQARYLEYIDRVTETHIGRYILWHGQAVPLFHDSVHPAGAAFQKLCEFAWRRMALAGAPPAFAGVDFWRCEACPVHPEIARRLGLSWADEGTRYACKGWGELTWEAWVRKHIETFG